MKQFSLNFRGRSHRVDGPIVMGIMNATPDSFYAGSRTPADAGDALRRRAAVLLEQGAEVIDVGGYSTRPGAAEVSVSEELRRVEAGIGAVRRLSSSIPVSVDTFRSEVAKEAVLNLGADMVNDVSGGLLDAGMFDAVADLKVPYVLTHMRGTPADMSSRTDYPQGVAAAVAAELSGKLRELVLRGVSDVIVDPGFGFAKTVGQNYELMAGLPDLGRLLQRPILVGVSRKSMVYRPLGISPSDALPGTIVLNTLALERGATILRVHDVAEAVQAVAVWKRFNEACSVIS